MDNLAASDAFAALGHENRLAILRFLVESGPGGADATTLSAELDIAWTTLSHHLDHLKRSGLVRGRKQGRRVIHTAQFDTVQALSSFLMQNCCVRQPATDTQLPQGEPA
ncbi:ArsR/SmtB family transcription factor [Minwuia sp.]|uniref:ArsR/SmtB family transcription factor n=1 Tax=Minwuia sp. TaxID=2493630 RepID=UPI003A8E0B7A